MTKNASHFAHGSAVYKCGCCGHNTRSTGRGDNENAELCAMCYDLAGEENSLSDNGEFYSSPAQILAMINAVKGDASCWAELKAKAEAA